MKAPAGRLLVPQSCRPTHVLVVETGAVALWHTDGQGRRTLIAMMGPHDVLGEEALGVDLGPGRRVEARALAFSTLLAVSPQDLQRTMARDASVAGWLAQALIRKIDLLQARMAATLGLGVRDRTLAILRSLAARWGKPSPRGTVVNLPLSQEDLAAMIGATRESVNRALRDLCASGSVLRYGRRYVIPDPSTRVNRSMEDVALATNPSCSNLIRWASTDRAAAGNSSAG